MKRPGLLVGGWLRLATGLTATGVVLTLHAAVGDSWQLTIATADDAGAPMAARVSVKDAAGVSHVPPVALTANVGPDIWFAGSGRDRLDLPEGDYAVRIERGPAYPVINDTVRLAKNTTREYRLKSWANMNGRGYRSGENHLHVAPGSLPALLAAEGLDYGFPITWWNGPVEPAGASAEETLATASGAEVEDAWGALYAVGLEGPVDIKWRSDRANLAYARAMHRRGGLVCYQGGWSREALVDALLGEVDVINIGDNLFQRHRFMPRSRNANLLGVPGLPVYPGTDEGMLRLACDSYYRLLNCGLHLAAGAGSATGVKANPAGYNRAYVKTDSDTGARGFLRAWREGRNFVTNGPMLFLTVGASSTPGDTVALPAEGGAVRVRASASSAWPLERARILINGEVRAESTTGELDLEVELKDGAWIAAIAIARDDSIAEEELARHRMRSPLGGEEPSRLLFAHTSPVYVTVGGRGARVPAAVAEAGRMIDAFETFARSTAAPEWRGEILAGIAEARARLKRAAQLQ